MVAESGGGAESGLTPGERDRLGRLRSVESLSELVDLTGADSEREAYFAARREWTDLRGRELAASAPASANGLPGNCVVVDGHSFWVHGITHADTQAERAFLRERVSQFLERGETVYCEQGIRQMYFADEPDVCEIDDLRWATQQCDRLDGQSSIAGVTESAVWDLAADVESLTDRLRRAVFSLVESNRDLYGDDFSVALGGLASALLTSHEDAAIGDDYESFTKTRRAAENPDELAELQQYYERTFLPQPIEREWLRRHDPELELLTHARNERMAAYAMYHNEDAEEVHLVVGAAHQPGVTYYLEQYRDSERTADDFEFVE